MVQSAISLFTSENTLTVSIPEAAAAFVPGSLNGCCHRDVAARAQGRDGAFAGHGSPGRGAAGTLGSGALGSGVPCTAAPESSSWDRQLRVLKDRRSFLWIDLAGRWGSSGAAGHPQLPICRKFRKCFGFRPVWTETKCREKPPENFCRPNSPSPTGAERPQPPAAPVGPGSAAGARWGWHRGRRHGRTCGNTRHCEQLPKAPCPDMVAGGTSGRPLQR